MKLFSTFLIFLKITAWLVGGKSSPNLFIIRTHTNIVYCLKNNSLQNFVVHDNQFSAWGSHSGHFMLIMYWKLWDLSCITDWWLVLYCYTVSTLPTHCQHQIWLGFIKEINQCSSLLACQIDHYKYCSVLISYLYDAPHRFLSYTIT